MYLRVDGLLTWRVILISAPSSTPEQHNLKSLLDFCVKSGQDTVPKEIEI
jgi:hypothetical protein